MSPVERVERLVRDGAIDASEGKRLLSALHARPAPSALDLVLHPFERSGGFVAAAVGLGVSVVSIAVARLGVRFDGFLDLHLPHVAVPLRLALADQAVAWLLPAFLFFGYARIVSRHVRLIDFVGMTGLSRLPLLVAALPLLRAMPTTLPDPLHPSPRILVVAVLSLVFVVLNVALLYQGFKNASGLAGPKLWVGFIGMVLGVEIVSKLALAALT